MSDTPKIDRVLKLMKLMTGNVNYTVDELAKRLNTSSRTIYRYIESFSDAGFVVLHSGNVYSLGKDSKHFKQISQLIHFTDEEAYIVNQLIDAIDDNNMIKQNLRNKLCSVYNCTAIADTIVKGQNAINVNAVIEAITNEKQVVLKNYHSAHTGKIRDRVVEPFGFTTNYVQIWCYDTEAKTNKLFKTSRVESVEILNEAWQHKADHKEGYIDIFRFTGFETHPVKLKLGVLAHSLLIEEYPLAERDIIRVEGDPEHWILDTQVCGYVGVGRFVIGLRNDITIIDTPELEEYIENYKAQYL